MRLFLLFFLYSLSAFATCEDTKLLYSAQFDASTGRFDTVKFMSEMVPKKDVQMKASLVSDFGMRLLKYRGEFAKLKAPQNTNPAVIKKLQKTYEIAGVFSTGGLTADFDDELRKGFNAGFIEALRIGGPDAWKSLHELVIGPTKKEFTILSKVHYEDVSGRTFDRQIEYKLYYDFMAEPPVKMIANELVRSFGKAKYTLSDHLYRMLVKADHRECLEPLKLGEKASIEAQKSVEAELKALEKRDEAARQKAKSTQKTAK